MTFLAETNPHPIPPHRTEGLPISTLGFSPQATLGQMAENEPVRSHAPSGVQHLSESRNGSVAILSQCIPIRSGIPSP